MFTKLREKELKFLKSRLVEYHHSSGAKILLIKNKDKDLSFSITFKTPVYNDKGIPHIIEHSVLSGSKKYPLKDPFAEILKSSIVSFINAFTFQDRTTYLFSTTNPEEYFKILDVYMDTVFNPLFVEKEEIFYNEGIRLVPKEGKVVPTGIVYNEMKGAYGSRDENYVREALKSLFSGAYGSDSGGDPKEILHLTYKEMVDFYKKHYTPANSYIYAYGDIDESEFLKKIEEYLVGDGGGESEINFDVSVNDSVFDFPSEGGTNVAGLNFPIVSNDIYEIYGLKVLDEFLVGMESSPLKELVEEAGLGDSVESYFGVKINAGIYSLIVKNLKENIDLREIVFSKLKEISQDVDRDTLKAALNQVEFYMMDAFSDQTLPYGLRIMYEIDPHRIAGRDYVKLLEVDEFFENLRKKLDEGYFNSLINKYLLQNNSSLVVLKDKPFEVGFEEEFISNLNLTESQVAEWKKIDQKVQDFVNQEDSEGLKLIDISKISKKPNLPNLMDEGKVYFNRKFTRGITHIDLLYNLEISEEELPYLGLLLVGLRRARTKSLSKKDFSNLVFSKMGNLGYDVLAYDKGASTLVNFVLRASFLDSRDNDFIDIFGELKSNLVFDENEIKVGIKEFIESYKSYYMYEDVYYLVNSRLETYSLRESVVAQKIKGLDFYLFLKDLQKEFKWQEIEGRLVELYHRLFDHLSKVLVTAENIPAFVDNFEFSEEEFKLRPALNEPKELVVVDTTVNFIGLGGPIPENFRGVNYPVKMLLRYGYLWDELRLKRGAYSPMIFTTPLTFNIVSFRDPNLVETFEVYSRIPQYLENLDLSDEELKRAIIIGISEFDRPKDPHDETQSFVNLLLRGFSLKDYEIWRTKILELSPEDLRKASNVLKEIIEKDLFVVVGRKENQEKIKFNRIIPT